MNDISHFTELQVLFGRSEKDTADSSIKQKCEIGGGFAMAWDNAPLYRAHIHQAMEWRVVQELYWTPAALSSHVTVRGMWKLRAPDALDLG